MKVRLTSDLYVRRSVSLPGRHCDGSRRIELRIPGLQGAGSSATRGNCAPDRPGDSTGLLRPLTSRRAGQAIGARTRCERSEPARERVPHISSPFDPSPRVQARRRTRQARPSPAAAPAWRTWRLSNRRRSSSPPAKRPRDRTCRFDRPGVPSHAECPIQGAETRS